MSIHQDSIGIGGREPRDEAFQHNELFFTSIRQTMEETGESGRISFLLAGHWTTEFLMVAGWSFRERGRSMTACSANGHDTMT